MLALSREAGEGVVVTVDGKQMRVVVVHTRRGKVRLGFDAPPEFIIERDEIRKTNQKGNQ